MNLREPLIHSHVTDVLPDDDPLAWTNVDCKQCGTMVHAFNNECMSTWVEAGSGNWCFDCFAQVVRGGVIEDEHGLPSLDAP